VAAHGHAGDCELKERRELLELRFGGAAAALGVRDDAHLMAALGLQPRQVEHVAKQSTDGRAQDVEDAKRAHLAQNQRSSTVMVSPGRTGKERGTASCMSWPRTTRATTAPLRWARGV
jgi:hypothetical protein